MTITLGGVLERLERARDGERFALLLPSTDGPCRFGAYKELYQLVLGRLGYSDRIRIWSPPFGDYFQGMPPGLGAVMLAGTVATDLLDDMRHDVRPCERRRGAASALHERFLAELADLAGRSTAGDISGTRVLREAATGRFWGVPDLLERAGREFAALRNEGDDLPLVLVVGEIYLRRAPFSNGNVVEALARRGVRAKIAGVSEFLQFSEYLGAQTPRAMSDRVNSWVRRRVEVVCQVAASRPMGWTLPPHVREVVKAAGPWIRVALEGETVLTVGAAVHAWRSGEVDGVLSVGPLECMPNKLAESQLMHVGEQHDLLSLTLSMNGDPVDPESLDSFAMEVHARHQMRRESQSGGLRSA